MDNPQGNDLARASVVGNIAILLCSFIAYMAMLSVGFFVGVQLGADAEAWPGYALLLGVINGSIVARIARHASTSSVNWDDTKDDVYRFMLLALGIFMVLEPIVIRMFYFLWLVASALVVIVAARIIRRLRK